MAEAVVDIHVETEEFHLSTTVSAQIFSSCRCSIFFTLDVMARSIEGGWL
jgi:hypothetical protein